MKMIRKALSVFMAGVFAASMCAMPALAASTPLDPSGPTRMYTVDVYGGNNGVVNGVDPYTVNVPAGSTFDFSGIEVQINSDVSSKYYVKGIRGASVNNAYTRDFATTSAELVEGTENTYGFSGSMTITQDTDLVVAYGIKSQRVNYTVRYIDNDGNEIADADTFIGDIGDRPAPAVKYIEGYLPRAMTAIMPPLKGGEENVITFDYVRLDPSYRVIYENEVIRIVTPEGEEIAVTPVAPEDAAAAGGEVAIVDDAGETILDADGNPLAAPVTEENLDDNDNPLASAAAGDIEGASNATSILSWLLPLLAGIVVAGLIIFFALLMHQRRKDKSERPTS